MNQKELRGLRNAAVTITKRIFALAEDEEKSLEKADKKKPEDSKSKLNRIVKDIRKEERNLREIHHILEQVEEAMIAQMQEVHKRAKESHKLSGVESVIDKEIGLFSKFLRAEALNVAKERREVKHLKAA